MNQKGFTLIELLIIIVIVGILCAVAIPRFQGVADRAAVYEEIINTQGVTQEQATAILGERVRDSGLTMDVYITNRAKMIRGEAPSVNIVESDYAKYGSLTLYSDSGTILKEWNYVEGYRVANGTHIFTDCGQEFKITGTAIYER